MSEKEKNKIIVMEPSTKAVQELVAVMKNKAVADVLSAPNADEAVQLAQQHSPCMMIICIMENSEIPQRVHLLKRLEHTMKQQGLKTFMVSKIKNRQMGELFTTKLGATDYIEEPVPVRTLQFKANLQLKAVDNFRRLQDLKKAAGEKVVIKTLASKRDGSAAAGKEVAAKGKPALATAEDSFLFKNSGVKKTGKKFVLELAGPDPETGSWVPQEDKGDAKQSWRWVPNEKNLQLDVPAAPTKDGWVHQGEKPIFLEDQGKWQFVTEEPSLALVADGKPVAEKFGMESGELFVAADSHTAEQNLRQNQATANMLKKLKKEQAELQAAAPTQPDSPALDQSAKKETAALPQEPPKEKQEAEKTAGMASAESTGKNSTATNQKATLSPAEARAAKSKAAAAEANPGSSAPSNDQPAKLETAKGEANAPALFQRKKAQPPKSADPLRDEVDEPESKLANDAAEKSEASLAGKAGEKIARSSEKKNLASPAEEPSSSEDDADSETNHRLGMKRKARKGPAPPSPAADQEQARSLAEASRLQKKTLALVPLRRQKEALDKKKQEVLGKIQGLLRQPLPAAVPPAEEAKLREELEIPNGVPSPKDLPRKARLARIKKLKNSLSDLNADLQKTEQRLREADGGETQNTEASSVLRDREEARGIQNAWDSEDAPGGAEGEEQKRHSSDQPEAQHSARDDNFFYLEAKLVQPIGQSWDPTGSHHVYLDATVRYRGFQRLENLLPLWIHAGRKMPELLDKTNQWRFTEALPFQAHTLQAIPTEVRDFLLELRKKLEAVKNKKERPADADKPVEAETEALAEEDDHDEAAAPEGLTDAATASGKEENEKESADEVEVADEDEAEDGNDASTEAAAMDEEGEKTEARSEKKKTAARQKKNRKSSQNPDAAGTPEDAESTSPEALAQKNPRNRPAADKPGYIPKDPSSGVQKFLERRQKKLASEGASAGESDSVHQEQDASASPASEHAEEGALSEVGSGKTTCADPIEGARQNPATAGQHLLFLGLMVAMSDSLSPGKNPSRAITRVLHAIEDTFGACAALVLAPDDEDIAAVTLHSRSWPETEASVKLSAGFAEAIVRPGSEPAEILGYLFVKVPEGKGRIGPDEEGATRDIAQRIWPLVANVASPEERKAA